MANQRTISTVSSRRTAVHHRYPGGGGRL